MVTVYNTGGTTNKKCNCNPKCDSMKDHWENKTDKTWPEKCSVFLCTKDADAGAHVSDTSTGSAKWIVPFCITHNNKPASTSFVLVPNVEKAEI